MSLAGENSCRADRPCILSESSYMYIGSCESLQCGGWACIFSVMCLQRVSAPSPPHSRFHGLHGLHLQRDRGGHGFQIVGKTSLITSQYFSGGCLTTLSESGHFSMHHAQKARHIGTPLINLAQISPSPSPISSRSRCFGTQEPDLPDRRVPHAPRRTPAPAT